MFSRRVYVAISAFSVLAFLGIAIFVRTMPSRELNAVRDSLVKRLEESKPFPPEDTDPADWLRIIGWTQVAIPNCFFGPEYLVDSDRFTEFSKLWDAKRSNPVEMSTIDWIWDELEILTKNGKGYSEKYRPTKPIGSVHENKQMGTDNIKGFK